MRDHIQRFMEECPEAKKQAFANNPFGVFVRTEIPEALYDTGLVDRENYLITASIGAGNWAMIPWICIFDRSITTSATKGIYIVYLLSKDSKRLYLTFNQGCTEISNSHGKRETIKIMRENAKEIVSYTDAHDFNVGDEIDLGNGLTSLGQYYERGTIYYKRYDVNTIPDEEQLRQDLANMMEIYKQYVQHQNSNEWWPSLAEYDPGFTKDNWLDLLKNPKIIGPVWGNVLAKFYDIGGIASCKQIEEHYGDNANAVRSKCTALAKAIHQETNCPIMSRDNGDNSYWKILFVGRKAEKEEAGYYVWKLRPELYEALSEFNILRYLERTGQFDSWTIVDQDTAIKKCDKDFIENYGSQVPKEIRWFFGAENLDKGETIRINFLYNDEKYEGTVHADNSESKRVRVNLYSSLGKQLVAGYEIGKSKATFHRKNENTYEVTIEQINSIIKMPERGIDVSIKNQIDQIKTYITAKGFKYDDGLVDNFYLSLKSKPFVILAGTSGTGKTRLVRLFAEAIGAAFEAVPVRPDWSDSTDLFGHVDLNGRFIPGKIIDFLWEARENPEMPFILCLDEMNLARVEYYLSDFLSVIETREMKDGRIVTDALVSDENYGIDTDAREQYGLLRFPENLYIVGTVNMDETTFPFSRKVLDRANTIEFNYVDLIPMWSDIVGETAPLKIDNTFLRSQYLRLVECPDDERDYVYGICGELEKLNQILARANAHVGYRVRDEIVFYMLNNKEAGLLDENAAMDNEIMQKILPRVQGSSASIKSMLCDLFKEIAGDYEGYQTQSNNTAERMLDLIQHNNHVRYPKSAEKIAFMVRRFEEDGFTSYWL